MELVRYEEFLNKVQNGKSGYVNGTDWLPFKSGMALLSLKDGKPQVGEVRRGNIVLGAVSLHLLGDEGEDVKDRVTPFNMSMLAALKNPKIWSMKIPFVVEKRISRAGNPYQQIVFQQE